MTPTLDKTIEVQATEILRATKNGELLSPRDLEIVQLSQKSEAGLSPSGWDEFHLLHDNVMSGRYTDPYAKEYPWLQGIRHFTQDPLGNLYWKGKRVGHYPRGQAHKDDARKAIRQIAINAVTLEGKELPVNERTVNSKAALEAPLYSPWKKALSRHFAFFESGSGEVVGIFLRNCAEDDAFPVVSATKLGGLMQVKLHGSPIEAFHDVRARGDMSLMLPCEGYDGFVNLMQRAGLSPAEADYLIG